MKQTNIFICLFFAFQIHAQDQIGVPVDNPGLQKSGYPKVLNAILAPEEHRDEEEIVKEEIIRKNQEKRKKEEDELSESLKEAFEANAPKE